MKKMVWLYALKDAMGNVQVKVVDDCADHLCIGGYDAAGAYQQYDSYEAYYMGDWALKHGFSYACQQIEIDVPALEFYGEEQ